MQVKQENTSCIVWNMVLQVTLHLLLLLYALHDVYLQSVHIRSLILALGTTEVRWFLRRAPPLVRQGQMKGVVSLSRE